MSLVPLLCDKMERLQLDFAEFGFLQEDFCLPPPDLNSEEYRWTVFNGLRAPSCLVEWLCISTLCRQAMFERTGVMPDYEEWRDSCEFLCALDEQ
jgi:hypothetical protein